MSGQTAAAGKQQSLTTIGAKPGLIAKFAGRFNVEPDKMLGTLRQTVFKGTRDQPTTNEQMMTLLLVADQYGLNPFTKEIYAFPDKHNGIVPVVGVDGWLRIINENPQFDGMDFEQDDASCTCIIYRKDRRHPIKVTEYLAECERNTEPWKKWPKRMMRHKAIIQCGRVAFGFAGIHDEDEANDIAGNLSAGDDGVYAPEAKPSTKTKLDNFAGDEREPIDLTPDADDVDPETGEVTEREADDGKAGGGLFGEDE